VDTSAVLLGAGPLGTPLPYLLVALVALTIVWLRRTRHVLAEATLVSEGRTALAEAQALAHIGSWEWHVASGVIVWSDELYRIYGQHPSSFVPSFETHLQHVHDDDRDRVHQVVARALESDGEFELEYRIVRHDGSVRTLACRGKVVLDHGGQPIKMVGTCQDVTALRDEQARFAGLVEAAPDAMVIADERGEIVLVNSQTERMFGYDRGELVGQGVELLMPDRLARRHIAHRSAFLVDPHARPMGSDLDLMARRKDGTEFPVEVSLSPITTETGVLVSSAIRDVTERKRAADALAHRAVHDALTGLPNRVLFLDRLELALARARRNATKIAVLFCDVDDFKRVNDSLGHDAGDQLLVALTPRLRDAVRPSDTVARFGGDEFVILCEDITDTAVAEAIAARITDLSNGTFQLEGREIAVSISAGLVVVDGSAAATPADVMRDADAAMYQAKVGGKGTHELFTNGTRRRAVQRLELHEQLRRAVRDGEFRLVYQPIVNIETGELVATEALLRWQHPERGLLAPDSFLHAVEEMNLILPLGQWVIEEAVAQAAAWRHAFPGAPLRVAVNISPLQVARGDLAPFVARTLAQCGLPAERLELELTETALFEEAGTATMMALHHAGVRIVLDDFGTGFSSLDHLRRLPVDAVKLDRSFVAGLGATRKDTAIVDWVIDLAGRLGVQVAAEGVENDLQLEHLLARGCTLAQGYLFSRAVDAEEISARLARVVAA